MNPFTLLLIILVIPPTGVQTGIELTPIASIRDLGSPSYSETKEY